MNKLKIINEFLHSQNDQSKKSNYKSRFKEALFDSLFWTMYKNSFIAKKILSNLYFTRFLRGFHSFWIFLQGFISMFFKEGELSNKVCLSSYSDYLKKSSLKCGIILKPYSDSEKKVEKNGSEYLQKWMKKWSVANLRLLNLQSCFSYFLPSIFHFFNSFSHL